MSLIHASADEAEGEDNKLVLLVNKWVQAHCMGVHKIDVHKCARPQEEYASRERDADHVQDLMECFKDACSGPEQPQVAIVWLTEEEEAFDDETPFVMGDNGNLHHPRLTQDWLEGFGRPNDADTTIRMIKGDHTSEAMRNLSVLYKSQRWKTLDVKILPLHRTQQNEDMAQGFGDLDNIKNVALARTSWSHLCRIKKEYDMFENISRNEYECTVKENTDRAFIKRMKMRKQLMQVTNKMSAGMLSSMWSMVSHGEEVWVQMKNIFTKQVVDPKTFKVPNTVHIFNQMGSVDDDFLVACLVKVVQRKEKLAPWFKNKCVEWKNKRRVKKEVLALLSALPQYSKFNKIEHWPSFCEASDNTFDEKWLDTWAFDMRMQRITPKKDMPHKFQTNVRHRLDKYERILKKKEQAVAMVKIFYLFVIVPFCRICLIARCFFLCVFILF
jgi:hypothetical protein